MEIKTVEMEIVKKKLSELKQNADNVRMHPDTQIREYMRSLEKNGQLKPFVIDEHGVIWIGNGLYQAMVKAGYEEGYCIVKANMTHKEKVKMMMADNRIFDLGVDDMAAFDKLVAELDGDFDIPGYDDELLNSLIASSDEVSDMMSSYGIVDEGRREAIADAKKVYQSEAAAEPTAPAERAYEAPTPETPNTTIDTDDYTPEPTRKFVICKKCGEKIWL